MVLTIASSQEMTDVMSAVIIVDFDASPTERCPCATRRANKTYFAKRRRLAELSPTPSSASRKRVLERPRASVAHCTTPTKSPREDVRRNA